MLSDPDRSNDFRLLERELYLTATDLDTTERVILGEGEWAEVPISAAVAASGALPGIYEPVEIAGREFIDGGILSTTNVDVAVERGAKFVVVINPLVPYVNDFRKNIPTITGSRAQRSPTWASARCSTRPSACSPTTGCIARSRSGRSAIRASTSS